MSIMSFDTAMAIIATEFSLKEVADKINKFSITLSVQDLPTLRLFPSEEGKSGIIACLRMVPKDGLVTVHDYNNAMLSLLGLGDTREITKVVIECKRDEVVTTTIQYATYLDTFEKALKTFKGGV